MTNKNLKSRIVWALLASFTLVGCSGKQSGEDPPKPSSQVIDSLTIYSIDGRRQAQPAQDGEKFHGYPVLGKVDVEDAGKRSALVAAVKKGMDDSDGTMAKCFWPRHGVRFASKGRTVEYVICFQCLQLQIHADGKTNTEAITESPAATLNQYLQNAKVPLAPAGE